MVIPAPREERGIGSGRDAEAVQKHLISSDSLDAPGLIGRKEEKLPSAVSLLLQLFGLIYQLSKVGFPDTGLSSRPAQEPLHKSLVVQTQVSKDGNTEVNLSCGFAQLLHPTGGIKKKNRHRSDPVD